MRKKHIYLVKSSNDLVSHCHCETAYVTFPPQMDCPWCGCGWLFTCTSCRKAFTFAIGVELEESWEETALRDLKGKWTEEPTAGDISQWIGAMQALLKNVQPGKEYVTLDGWFLPVDSEQFTIEGWHSSHEFPLVPHVAALNDRRVVENVLCTVDYWQSRRIDRGENDER